MQICVNIRMDFMKSIHIFNLKNCLCLDREVVFQCRDEGPLRARVHWVRGNGLPLPPGSRDINGRLEMPNIKVEHSGAYICEAIGYPPDTPGSRVSVQLQVEKCKYGNNNRKNSS